MEAEAIFAPGLPHEPRVQESDPSATDSSGAEGDDEHESGQVPGAQFISRRKEKTAQVVVPARCGGRRPPPLTIPKEPMDEAELKMLFASIGSASLPRKRSGEFLASPRPSSARASQTPLSSAPTLLGGTTPPSEYAPWYAGGASSPRSMPPTPPSLRRYGPLQGTALVAACAYNKVEALRLPDVLLEQQSVTAALRRAFTTKPLKEPSFADVCRAVRDERVAVLFLSFHGDAQLPGRAETMPIFVAADGRPEAHTAEAIADGLKDAAAAASGRLTVVVLNGCRTRALGARLGAFVDFVLCWDTIVHTAAARIFGAAFAAALVDDERMPAQREAMAKAAFAKARAAVEAAGQIDGQLDNGQDALIPKYILDVDPLDESQVRARGPAAPARLRPDVR